MIMTKKYEILSKFIKDMSSETKDIETYIFVRDHISKYKLDIDINSKVIKEKIIEINTTMKFEDKENSKKKAYFEVVYTTIVKILKDIGEKKELEQIILRDVQVDISKDLEGILLDLLRNSGYPGFKLEKNLDFVDLYNKRKS